MLGLISHKGTSLILSINNLGFENYLDLMYPIEREIDREQHICFLSRFTPVDWEGRSTSHASIYNKRDDFNFDITNFPFLSSNIPS